MRLNCRTRTTCRSPSWYTRLSSHSRLLYLFTSVVCAFTLFSNGPRVLVSFTGRESTKVRQDWLQSVRHEWPQGVDHDHVLGQSCGEWPDLDHNRFPCIRSFRAFHSVALVACMYLTLVVVLLGFHCGQSLVILLLDADPSPPHRCEVFLLFMVKNVGD